MKTNAEINKIKNKLPLIRLHRFCAATGFQCFPIDCFQGSIEKESTSFVCESCLSTKFNVNSTVG